MTTPAVLVEPKVRSSARYFDSATLKKDIKNRAIRGASLRVVSQGFATAAQMIGSLVLVRLLIPDDFGLVAIVAAYSMIMMDLGDMGLATAIVQAEAPTHEQVSSLFWINFGASSAVALLFAALSPILAWFYNDPRLISIAVVFSIVFVFKGLGTQHRGLMNRNMEFGRAAIIDLAGIVSSVAVALIMALYGWGYWALVARRVVDSVVSTVGAWVFCGWRPGFYLRSDGTGKLVKFGLHCVGVQALQSFRKNTDNMLLGWKYGVTSVGLYDRAFQLFVLPFNQLISPISAVIVAALSRLRSDRERLLRYYFRTISMVTFAGMALSVIFTLAAQDLVIIMAGVKWRDSGLIFMAFGPGIGMLLLSRSNAWLQVALGQADRLFRWTIIEPIVNTICLLIGLKFGPLGVAIAYSTSLYLLFFPAIWYAGRPIDLKVWPVAAVVLRYFVSGAAAVFLSWYLLHSLQVTSQIYMRLSAMGGDNIYVSGSLRVLIAGTLGTAFYLAFVLLVHGGPKPLKEVYDLASDIFRSRKQRPA